MEYREVEARISRIYPLSVFDQGKLHGIPVPLARITTCGMVTIEMLTEIEPSDPPHGRYEVIPTQTLRGRGAVPALTLLKLLAGRPHRFAPNDWLCEQMRGEMEVGALVRLDTIASYLRGLLCGLKADQQQIDALRVRVVEYLRNGRSSGPGYRLAPYPLIWIDTDALAFHVEHGALMERMGEPMLALPFWERAYQLASRGVYLPDEPSSEWAENMREQVEGSLRQSVHALSRLTLAQHGEAGEEEAMRLLRTYWQSHKTDEDALRSLMELLGKQERFGEAEQYYQQCVTALDDVEEGRRPDQRTDDIREFLHTKHMTRQRSAVGSSKETISHQNRTLERLQLYEETQGLLAHKSLASFPAFLQDIMREGDRSALKGQDMDHLRRQILHYALGIGATALIAHETSFCSDIADRLSQVLTKSSIGIDEKSLLYLERRIKDYWQDRNDALLPSQELLHYVINDLQKITHLLDGSLLPDVRRRLCSIAGIAAMLAGELSFDMSSYAQARTFHEVAITAAHEAHNTPLEAVIWGRKSFAWTYDGHVDKALTCIQRARSFTEGITSTVSAWLAAVEAEIQATLGDREACLKALSRTAHGADKKQNQAESYWIHFDPSLVAGYQGVSFLRLSTSGHKDLVQNGYTALQDALALLDPSMKRRQPTLLVDLAGTYVQQGNIEQACECALQAMTIAACIKSSVSLQRLLRLRRHLDPWKETRYVKELDMAIEPLLPSGREQESA